MKTGSASLYLADEGQSLFQVGPAATCRFDMPQLSCLDPEVELEWLWDQRIPLGMVTLIEGPPGVGKSFIVHDLAARVTTGADWPDGQTPQRDPARCLVICRQDAAGGALARRLELAGADGELLRHFWRFATVDNRKRTAKRPASFPGDLPALDLLVKRYPDMRLIVFDPLSDVCSTSEQINETLHRLNEFASEHGIAVVATLRATVKFDSRGGIRVKSGWRTDAARCTWCLAFDPADDSARDSRRLFVPTRMSFCAEPQGLSLSLAGGHVAWRADIPVDRYDPARVLSGCAQWLLRLLTEGDVRSKDVYRLGQELGFTVDMLKYAKKKIGAHRHRMGGFEAPGYWLWSLSAERPSEEPAAISGAGDAVSRPGDSDRAENRADVASDELAERRWQESDMEPGQDDHEAAAAENRAPFEANLLPS